ncbi:hypothetical protein Drorol1_Dr00024225 [Drosera rotundifolia]
MAELRLACNREIETQTERVDAGVKSFLGGLVSVKAASQRATESQGLVVSRSEPVDSGEWWCSATAGDGYGRWNTMRKAGRGVGRGGGNGGKGRLVAFVYSFFSFFWAVRGGYGWGWERRQEEEETEGKGELRGEGGGGGEVAERKEEEVLGGRKRKGKGRWRGSLNPQPSFSHPSSTLLLLSPPSISAVVTAHPPPPLAAAADTGSSQAGIGGFEAQNETSVMGVVDGCFDLIQNTKSPTPMAQPPPPTRDPRNERTNYLCRRRREEGEDRRRQRRLMAERARGEWKKDERRKAEG